MRIAVGAGLSRVRRLVLGQALAPVAVGLAAGVLATHWTSRLVASQLFQVEPGDSGVLVLAAMVVLAACAGAAVVPIRRATRVNPVEALRAE